MRKYASPLALVLCCSLAVAQGEKDVTEPGAVTFQTARGEVRQYLLAPRGEVDGILLRDGTQVVVAPHLAQAITDIVRPGDMVELNGVFESATRFRLEQLKDASNGAVIADDGPQSPQQLPSPTRQRSLIDLSAKGRVIALLSGPRGELNGAVLDDRTVLRFSPRAGLYYADQLKPGSVLTADGLGTENEFGRVIDVDAIHD